MQLLGDAGAEVVSLAASPTQPGVFAALEHSGTLRLCDVRLPGAGLGRAAPAGAPCVLRSCGGAAEVQLSPDGLRALTLCGAEAALLDWRRPDAAVAAYAHGAELVRLLDTPLDPAAADTTLLADEDGAVVPYSWVSGAPVSFLDDSVFGAAYELPGGRPWFGGGVGECCGLGLLPRADGGGPLLLSVGMDGRAALYASPHEALPLSLMGSALSPAAGGGQIVNPPIPTCTGFGGERVALGTGSGAFGVWALSEAEDSLELLLSQPAVAHTGLCAAEWCGDALQNVLSVALSGDVGVWAVDAWLDGETDSGGGVPLLASCSHREATGRRGAVVNCATTLGEDDFLIADCAGCVTRLQLSPL